jgi:hypothetical protein
MKNLIAILVFSLFTISLVAQYESKGILISTSLGVAKTELSSLTSNPQNGNIPPPQSISKSFSFAPEISYVASEKFMIGLGYFSNEIENSFKSSITNFINGNPVIVGSFSNLSSTKISGLTLHMRYSQNILSKLIVSLKFTYLNLKGENLVESSNIQNNPNFPSQIQKNTSNFNLGEARFSPSLHYFISKKFGCYVEVLGLNLKFSDSRKANKDMDYNFDLNPTNWRVGFFYFIPTQKAIE